MKIDQESYRTQELLFRAAMWWRIGYGVVRIIFGSILLRIVGKPLSDIFYQLMEHELLNDPNDVLIQIMSPLVQHLPVTITYFVAIYFLFWGVVDIILSIQLLKHRLWAFPLAIFLIIIFVIYEIYRYTHTHSLILLGVIAIDIVVALLIYREYRQTAIMLKRTL